MLTTPREASKGGYCLFLFPLAVGTRSPSKILPEFLVWLLVNFLQGEPRILVGITPTHKSIC